MNIKYSKILEQKIEEIHKTIYKNVQKQNKSILDNYVKKFNDLEKNREKENIKLSKIIIKNNRNQKQNKKGNQIDIPNKSICMTVHKEIKCNKCNKKPIVGFRYKCTICDNYNLCEQCEENTDHIHDFIKINEEEKEEEKILSEKINDIIISDNNNENKINISDEIIKNKDEEKYSFKILSKDEEFFISNNSNYEKVSIILKNDGNLDWPEFETKLICDTNNSLLGFNDIVLPPLKIGHHDTIYIELNIPSEIPLDSYIVCINFNIKGKNYGEQIKIKVNIVTEVDAFRKCYGLEKESFSDQQILDALTQYRQWDAAFNLLIKVE